MSDIGTNGKSIAELQWENKELRDEIEKLRAQIPDRASLVDVVMAATDLNDHADDYGVPWSRELDAAITKVRETIT